MKVVFRIFLSVLLGFFVLAVSGIFESITAFVQLRKSHPWLPITHTVILILSFILIYLFSKGRISTYGLKMLKIKFLKQPLLIGTVVGIVAGGLILLLPTKGIGFLEKFSFLQVVVFIWIYASISEELLTRGFIQSFLEPLIKYRVNLFKFYISVPMFVGALFFGLMHLGLLAMNVDKFFVLLVVFFAIVLGLAAGYYRETTGSIIPSIVIHMLFNVWGTIIGLLGKLTR